MSRSHPTASMFAVVAAGGAAGAVLRWAAEAAVPDHDGFPWTTLAVNVAGAFALALLPVLATPTRRPLLALAAGPGLLGGFTTMSAAAEQTRALLDEGSAGLAAGYLVGTLLAALLAARLGSALAGQAVVGDELT